jgi:hypothetical protein
MSKSRRGDISTMSKILRIISKTQSGA